MSLFISERNINVDRDCTSEQYWFQHPNCPNDEKYVLTRVIIFYVCKR